MRASEGFAVAFAALGLSLAAVVLIADVRPDVISALQQPVFLLSAGLFLLLGLASSAAVVAMARPQVGSEHSGWIWAAAMAALLPVAAVIVALADTSAVLARSAAISGSDCLLAASGLGLLTFAALTWWLRRGAPTSPDRAGLVTGIAAGSFGIFAYSFNCTYSDIVHIGLWHSAAVATCAMIGRLVVPHLIRW
jgi:hypothetical protein